MAEGVWSMTEDGEWVLAEPYRSQLAECKVLASKAWTETVIAYLAERTDYEPEFLVNELVRRNERPEGKIAIVDEFIVEALTHDL